MAWFCIGAGERSVAAGFGAPEGAVEVDHPALHQLGRSEPEIARHELGRGGDGLVRGWASAAAVVLEPPRPPVGTLRRAPAPLPRRAGPSWPERSSRGPPR
ncbi:MAG TPA: hypothetical protein VKZ18_14470 [Polyangia bacterium]|nr:hypothetical protein [Polyangia bacterium]